MLQHNVTVGSFKIYENTNSNICSFVKLTKSIILYFRALCKSNSNVGVSIDCCERRSEFITFRAHAPGNKFARFKYRVTSKQIWRYVTRPTLLQATFHWEGKALNCQPACSRASHTSATMNAISYVWFAHVTGELEFTVFTFMPARNSRCSVRTRVFVYVCVIVLCRWQTIDYAALTQWSWICRATCDRKQ